MTTPTPPSYAYERPFDYAHPSVQELRSFIGGTWCIARRTPGRVAQYGADCTFLSQSAYKKAEAKAIKVRGWGCYAEKIIRDLLACEELDTAQIKRTSDATIAAIDAARGVLAKAPRP